MGAITSSENPDELWLISYRVYRKGADADLSTRTEIIKTHPCKWMEGRKWKYNRGTWCGCVLLFAMICPAGYVHPADVHPDADELYTGLTAPPVLSKGPESDEDEEADDDEALDVDDLEIEDDDL